MMQKLKNYPVSFVKVIFGYSLYITLIFNYPLVGKLNNFFDISPGHLELFEYFFFFLVPHEKWLVDCTCYFPFFGKNL